MTYRLLMLSDNLTAGGGTRALVNFARLLDPALFTPAILGVTGDAALAECLQRESFRLALLSGPGELSSYLQRHPADIVLYNRSGEHRADTDAILHCLLERQVPAIERNIFGNPDPSPCAYVISLHLHQSVPMLKRYLALADLSDDEETLRRHALLPNPVCLERLEAIRRDLGRREALRRELGIPEDAVVVGQICRPDTEKWDDVHLHMLRRIVRACPQGHYLIKSPPPSREKRIRRIGGEQAHLLPFTTGENDAYEALAMMDVYAHASRIGECFGNAINEAMAMGLPVVTRSTPQPKLTNGQIFQVDHGRTGYVADTSRTYAGAVIELINNPELRSRMGNEGNQKVLKEYSPDTLARHLENCCLLAMGELTGKRSSAVSPAMTSGKWASLKQELSRRERLVFGPPTVRDRIGDWLEVPHRLLQRARDKWG